MRFTIALAALAAATPLHAAGVAVESAVFLERSGQNGLSVAPSERFVRGDHVITVMTWQAQRSDYKIVSQVPARLELQSVSRNGLEFSTDRGETWHVLADGREIPHGVTHLRWRASGDGRLTYRAVVR